MSRWKISSVQRIYKRCLSHKHEVVVVRATFNCVYAYCKACGKVYRIRAGVVEELPEEEGEGRSLREEVCKA
ncbi:MAG: hypothetical protein QKV96_gp13 [Methanophagales virus GBV303]|uniref:Uncharacterized protein n=1 Tax=Methanophagales virus GBV303 TaxID=2986514 RepID=A0A9E8V9Q7_9VIRU|nr:MAG: hypothetical protein QKV96_gp13 [Methanophagales virus GBV303]WAE39649.1 MAG: hypothetical protein NNKAGPMP_00013 [Methanophagales virus GBV303]